MKNMLGKLIFVPLANLLAFGVWYSWKDSFDLYLYEFVQWGLLAIPVLSIWYFFSSSWFTPIVRISSVRGFGSDQTNWKEVLRHSLFAMRMTALAFLIMAASRPQMQDSEETVNTEGIDIIMCMDLSSSMLAMDLEPNRLEASKEVAADFVEQRTNDRFGLVFYAGNARTMSPLTIDHQIVRQQILRKANVGFLEDGTAIGLGLGYAVNRLRDSEAPSKVIILLTDGENNVLEFPPLDYAEAAKEFDVKVYTIGVGATYGDITGPIDQYAGVPQYGPISSGIDEATLMKIAKITGGKYFRANDNEKLKDIYDEIDSLEKIEIEKQTFYNPAEKFQRLAVIGLVLLLLGFVLRYTVFWSAT